MIVKDCVDDENKSSARCAANSTEQLVRTVAEEPNLARYVDRLSKKEKSDASLQELEEKPLHGQFLKEMISIEKHYKWI